MILKSVLSDGLVEMLECINRMEGCCLVVICHWRIVFVFSFSHRLAKSHDRDLLFDMDTQSERTVAGLDDTMERETTFEAVRAPSPVQAVKSHASHHHHHRHSLSSTTSYPAPAPPSPELTPQGRPHHHSDAEHTLVSFTTSPPDPENPKNWSVAYKWYCTMVVALTCFVVAFNSSVITADIAGVAEEFGVSEEVALLSISVFVVGFGVGPMVFAPLSEVYGRRVI